LSGFPFSDFRQFRAACSAGTAVPLVNRHAAREWALRGIDSTKGLRLRTRVLIFLPYCVVLAFLLYALAASAYLLLAPPLLILGFLIFNPGWVPLLPPFLGGIRQMLIILILVMFAWAWYASYPGVTAIAGALLMLWYGQRALEDGAVRALIRAATANEDLLCALRTANVLAIQLPDGRHYRVGRAFDEGPRMHSSGAQ
jgi:hypothetical protein